jgi:hypothetical protein
VTEADWCSATDPSAMVAFLRGRGAVSDRRLRLFGCACARRVLPFVSDARFALLVAAAERAAEGEVAGEVEALVDEVQGQGAERRSPVEHSVRAGVTCVTATLPNSRLFTSAVYWLATAAAWQAAPNTPEPDDWDIPSDPAWRAAWDGERAAQAGVLRDIIVNPFRPATIDLSWQTSTVVPLARNIYDAQSFELMPVLADALMDAGCSTDEVLEHCRGPNNHVRGCWLIDLLLAKE